jgi:hypothetical protein
MSEVSELIEAARDAFQHHDWAGARDRFNAARQAGLLGGHQLADLRRAGEWTEATARWCERLPEAVLYRGLCRVHRAQVLQVRGAWEQAEREAARASSDLQGVHLGTVA